MGILTQDMKEVIVGTRLAFVATINADGTPNLSPKSSLKAIDDDHIAFANIASPNTVANLKVNPATEINAVDIFMRRGYRFTGTASLEPPGTEIYKMIAEPFWAGNGEIFPVHEVVKVKLSSARPVVSPAYTYIEGLTDDGMREAYQKKYGVQPLED